MSHDWCKSCYFILPWAAWTNKSKTMGNGAQMVWRSMLCAMRFALEWVTQVRVRPAACFWHFIPHYSPVSNSIHCTVLSNSRYEKPKNTLKWNDVLSLDRLYMLHLHISESRIEKVYSVWGLYHTAFFKCWVLVLIFFHLWNVSTSRDRFVAKSINLK